jgi:hypothetical protein
MRTVTIRVRGADFAGEMIRMRTWLDQHMFKPEKFIYEQDQHIITISLDFLSDHHAEAFKSHFDGQEPDSDILPPRGGVGQLRTKATPGTMAQACRWRLLAEEIRTEADNLGSASAKETMELAARGWEQLAEELEHRLERNGGAQRGFFGAADGDLRPQR